MTDFNRINPNKGMQTNFSSKRQSHTDSQPTPGANAGPSPNPSTDLTTDPNTILNLMAAQGRQNIQGKWESPVIENSVQAFTGNITPDDHAQVTSLMVKTYENEFGRPPSPGLLQDMVDNYLIGSVVINNPPSNG